MSVDTPKQIDLSQDIQEQGIQLSPEQQESFQKYLDGLKEEEKQGIIYLTQQELTNLATAIDNSISWENDAQDFVVHDSEKLDTFIQEQKTEGLASSDLLPETEGNLLSPELLDTFDSVSHETLFGEEGMFSGLDISDTAKDQASVSLTLALIENTKSNPERLAFMIQEIKAGNNDIATNLVSQYNENFTGLWDILSGFEGISGEILISGQGEQNALFMNTETGKEFFNGILSGEITQANITTHIQEHNSDTPLEASLGDITEISSILSLTEQELQDIVTSSGSAGEGAGESGTGDTPEEALTETTPEQAQSAIDSLKEQKPFGPFLAVLLEALQGIVDFGKSISGSNEGDTSGTTTESEDTDGDISLEAQDNISNMVELVESLDTDSETLLGNKEVLMKELQGDPNLAQRIQSLLEGVSTEESFSKTFKSLGLTEKGNSIASIFQEHGIDSSLPAGTSLGNKVLKYIEEYARYRNSDGVRNLSKGRTTWEEYARQRQAENWSTGGR